MLRGRREEHGHTGNHADRCAVHCAQQALLEHQRFAVAGFDLTQRDAAQRNGHRLTARIARLPGENRQERSEDDQPVDGALKHRYNTAGKKSGQQIQQQPWMTEFKTLQQRR